MKLDNLNPNLWYVRWFFWSTEILDEFTGRNRIWDRRHHGTNLCQFIRVTLVWCPLVLLLHSIMYGAAVFALTVTPVYLFGGYFYACIIGAIVALICMIFGIKWFNRRRYERERRSPRKRDLERERAELVVVAKDPDFFEVLGAYLAAKKQKVCPMMTFATETGEAE
jgi:membrane protein implicated in regulation of membrane protease activity